MYEKQAYRENIDENTQCKRKTTLTLIRPSEAVMPTLDKSKKHRWKQKSDHDTD